MFLSDNARKKSFKMNDDNFEFANLYHKRSEENEYNALPKGINDHHSFFDSTYYACRLNNSSPKCQ